MSSNEPVQRDRPPVLVLTVSYDGSQFAGSQRQGRRRTVQAELERALSEFWGANAVTVFAGRTDQGVHAAGQRVSADDRRPHLSNWRVRNAINVRLPGDVSVVLVERRPAGFHARYDAIWREYRYRLWTGVRQPLVASTVAQRERGLNFDQMASAAKQLIGEHDLASFAGGGEGVPWSERQLAPRGTVRNILACDFRRLEPWWGAEPDAGELIEIRIAADGFLPRMVRNIAGALIEIGRGERPPEWIAELIAERDRRLAGMTAPAHGLILWRVGYPGDELLESGRDAPVGR